VLTIRQKVWIAVGVLLRILARGKKLRGCTSAIRDGLQRSSDRGREDNGATRAPTRATTRRGIAEDLHGAAVNCDFFQLALRKETEILAIGRPEGESSPVGTG